MFILSGNGIYGVIPIHCCSKARQGGKAVYIDKLSIVATV